MLDFALYLLKYIPFWAVPVLILSLQFGYIFYVKEIKKVYIPCFSLAVISSFLILYYLYAGSPVRSPGYFYQFIQNVEKR